MTKTTWQVQQYLEVTARANGEDPGEVKRELMKGWGSGGSTRNEVNKGYHVEQPPVAGKHRKTILDG